MKELYKVYRPKSFKTVIGQAAAVASIQKLVEADKIPHAILLTGPSGVGKTTIARIVASILNCSEMDFIEKNCADLRGIDEVREMRSRMGFSPIGGDARVFLLDEVHKMTGDAQNALLVHLEDTPSHVYFILCTTDPAKVIKAIHTRCSEVKLSAVNQADLIKVINRVVEREELKVSAAVVEAVAEASEGSPRKALVILEQVCLLDGDKEQIEAIQATTFNKDVAYDLAKLIVYNRGAKWPEVAKVLEGMKEVDPESVRYVILGCARASLLKNGGAQAFKIIDCFSRNFYDSKQAGLAAACYEVVCGK